MKTGKSITELAAQLQDIRDNARDIILPTSHLDAMTAVVDDNQVKIQVKNGQDHRFAPSTWAGEQTATYTGIPKPYYDRLGIQNTGLLAANINHGFAMAAQAALVNKRGGGRMLRTYKGDLRALVSSSYRTLDNFDLFEAVAPTLIDLAFEPVSTDLTPKRLYLKVVSPKVQAEVVPGDVVQYGLVVSNSDVGAGSVRVEPLIYRLVCRNGLITETAIRKAHLGRNLAGDNIQELFSDRTNQITDQAFWMQIRDVVSSFAKPEFFEMEVNKLREAAKVPIKNFDFDQIIERTAKQINLTIGDVGRKSILESIVTGADGAGLNKWGLANAFTRAAQAEVLDYETATDWERAGSKVIDLNANQWRTINEE